MVLSRSIDSLQRFYVLSITTRKTNFNSHINVHVNVAPAGAAWLVKR